MTGSSGVRKALAVYRREMYEIRSWRSIAMLGLLAALQAAAMAASRATGRAEDVAMVFMLGGLFAVLAGYDLVTREREAHTIDLLLLQGLSRDALFAAKWAAAASCAVAMAAAIAGGGAAGALVSGKRMAWADWTAELSMTAWFLGVYALMALAWSTAMRRGKRALAAAAITWLLLRPPFVALVVLRPLRDAYGWSQARMWTVLAWLPEFAFRIGLDPAHGAPLDARPPRWLPFTALAACTAGGTLVAWLVFRAQDERS